MLSRETHPHPQTRPATRRPRGPKPTALVLRAATISALIAAHALAAPPVTTAPSAANLEEAAFREGLRQRGLTDWLQQYLSDTLPLDGIDHQLRDRDQDLNEAASLAPGDPRRRELITRASGILSSLITGHPEHPARLQWRLELARDQLERTDPAMLDALLLYDLPGRDRTEALKLSTQAAETLEALRREIAESWKAVESLDEAAVQSATAQASLRTLELLDGQSAMLLAWADLYRFIAADIPAAKRHSQLAALLTQVSERYGWTDADRPAVPRCSALVIAAIAGRLTGQFAAAEGYAREIIAAFREVKDPADRKRLRQATLLAVLEQIRLMRDRGQWDEALKAMQQARDWAERTRRDDLPAALAVALVERSVLAGRALAQGTGPGVANSPSTQPQTASRPAGQPFPPPDLLQPTEALAPLERFAGRSAACRDLLYAVLAGALADEPIAAARSPFALQLVAGAATAEAMSSRAQPQPGLRERLHKVIVALRAMVSAPPADLAPPCRGELLFLLGRAYYLTGMHLEAAGAMADLVEKSTGHDRAGQAAEQAVAIAQELLHTSGQQESAAARDAFIRAVQVLRKRWPDSATARKMQYFLGVALEASARPEDAATEYAAVSSGDARVLEAALGRARCLRNALTHAVTEHTSSETQVKDLAAAALKAAQEAVTRCRTGTQPSTQNQHRWLAAEATLLLANLLNHSAVARPAEALAALEGFERQSADQPTLVGAALRERVVALRQLKRLGEARQVVQQFLTADPENAGPVMANLLEAMRDEINAQLDRNEVQAAHEVAGEAAQLAATLLTWSDQHAGRIKPVELLTIRVWQAWSLQQAGQATQALRIYDACNASATDGTAPDAALRTEIMLGRAECLLALDQAADALPIFTETWTRSPERSFTWWRALAGSLACHTRLGSDPQQILQSIRQQRHLNPDLGGPRWKRTLEAIEQANLNPTASRPANR